jgi:hypothetical protein
MSFCQGLHSFFATKLLILASGERNIVADKAFCVTRTDNPAGLILKSFRDSAEESSAWQAVYGFKFSSFRTGRYDMKNLVDILLWIVTIGGFAVAIWQFYLWEATDVHPMSLWAAIAAAIVGCIGILGFFLRHVNKEEEIHITQ